MAGAGVQGVVVGKHAGQHHGAGHGNGHAEHGPGQERKTEQGQYAHAGHGGQADLGHSPGHGDIAHGQQILEMEVQAHAEHQQDHADLRALGRRGRVGHKARRMRAHQHARQQIAHQGRKMQLLGDETQHQGGGKATGQSQDQSDFMRAAHGRASSHSPFSPGSHCSQRERRRGPSPSQR